MAEIKYMKDNYTTENPFVDIIMSNVKALAFSAIVKDAYTADAAETTESLKESEIYISCVEGRAELGLFEKIPHSFLVSVGVPKAAIDNYEQDFDQAYIPLQFHKPLEELMMPYYIENYDEKNEYYRMITGLPPHGDPGVPIRDYDYLIPDYITYTENFFHEESADVNKSFEIAGVLDVVRAEYPEYKYLNYLTQGVSIYDARKKMDFSLLFYTDEANYAMTKEFERKYEECRKFVLNTQYSIAYDIESPYYHSFMLAYCLLITVLDMLVEVQAHIVKKDILDRRCIQYIFSMYEIPYYRTIPYKYQERMCKNVHNLVKYKSTDTEFFSLKNLFGFEDIEIFKWFILKDRKTNAWGEFIYNTTSQMVCYKNDFIQQDTVVVKMSDTQTRGAIPEDIQYMRKYFDNLNPSPSSSTQYVDRYIPFPFEYFLQKGNVMIVRLDNYILKENEYEIYDYNIIRFKNGIAFGKSTITFYFYYDKDTMDSDGFLVDDSNRVETYLVDGERMDDDHKFDLRDTAISEFFTNPKNEFNVILNNVWLDKSLYTVDYDERTITLDSSIAVDKYTDITKFAFIKPRKFRSLYDKQDVMITTANQTNVEIPEPFANYCIRDNEFFVSVNDKLIDESEYSILPDTDPNPSYIVMTNPLSVGDKVSFHFFYSNQSSLTTVDLQESVEVVKATENYQYNFPVHFPVENFVTSGYKVYVKLLDWWLPDIYYTTIGQGTLTILDRSICDPNPGREMELHYFYLPYDRNEYNNIVVETDHVESKEDFQKKFPIKLPFPDFFDKGNKLVVDSEGVLLREGTDYTMSTPVAGEAVITVPNRDYRPMKGMRLNYTFFYLDESSNRIGITSKNLGTLTAIDQEIEIPFPFYPYFKTGQGFILYIGDKIITHEDIKMTDKFHCKIPNLTIDDIGSNMHIILFYNKLYTNSATRPGKFIVEWRQQYITDQFIIMDTPAEMYVENKWPYFVSYGNRLYLDESKYDVINHTLYTSPVSDLMDYKYGYYLNFVYIYTLKEGYMSEDTIELHSSNSDMYFAKAPIEDMYQVQYIKDKANWKSYDAITNRDGWWDGLYYKHNAHDVIKNEIYQKKFNYERTKYYGISNTIDLGEYSAQISYFYSILYDDVFYENNVDVLIPILSPSHRFKLAHLFIYMEVLTYIFNGFEDFIIDRPTKWMYVFGFNFKTDVNDLKKYLKKMHQHNSDFPIWDYINEDSELDDIVQFFNLFKENYHVRQTILKAMVKADDYREYSIWKNIYNSLLIWKLNMDCFNKSDGTPAETYTEFLKDKDTLLYESIMDIKSITDQETLEDTIINICDSIIYILEEYIDSEEFKYLFSMYPGHDPNKASKYLYMMIDFFKSYKITLLGRTETMDLSDPNDPDNYFRGIDQIEKITESTLTADYMIPTETFNTKETMELHEWISVPDTTSQLIEYPYPTHNANDTPTTPLDKTSNVRSLHVKGDYKVTPPDYNPVVTLTKIRDEGRWMKEDVSIELYGKDRVRFEFYPCIINTNKLPYEHLLDSTMEYIKQLSETFLDSTTNIDKEPFEQNILHGETNMDPIDFEVQLLGIVELTGRLFLWGYKMMTVYEPIYTTMIQVPTADIPDLNDRIIVQRNSTLMTLEEMYKGSTKLEVVPAGLEYANFDGMLYYNNFIDFCADCISLKYFPFKTTYFHYDNEDNIFDRAFYNCRSLVRLEDFNLSEYAACDCKNSFIQAFYNCTSLTQGVGLIGVTRDLYLNQAFYNCTSLTEPPIIRVQYNDLNLSQAFANCSSMEYIPTIFFPSTNALYSSLSTVNLDYTFDNCYGLKNDASKTGRTFIFNATNVNALRTFNDCSALKRAIQCEFSNGTKAVFEESYTGCINLEVSAPMKVEKSSELRLKRTYADCKNLSYASIILADDSSKVYLDHTFAGCDSLSSIDNLIGTYGGEFYLDHTFKDCTSLTTATIDFSRLKSWDSIFEGCTGLTQVTFVNTTPATPFLVNHTSLDGTTTLSYSIIYA